MEIRVKLVLIPLLIALFSVAISGFLCVKKGLNHGRSVVVRGVNIGMTPAALPQQSSDYLLISCSTWRRPV
jgi:hypothetical protein